MDPFRQVLPVDAMSLPRISARNGGDFAVASAEHGGGVRGNGVDTTGSGKAPLAVSERNTGSAVSAFVVSSLFQRPFLSSLVLGAPAVSAHPDHIPAISSDILSDSKLNEAHPSLPYAIRLHIQLGIHCRSNVPLHYLLWIHCRSNVPALHYLVIYGSARGVSLRR
jgi:hypothetical protein